MDLIWLELEFNFSHSVQFSFAVKSRVFAVLGSLLCTHSLLVGTQAELTFSAGDVIHVFGDMDEDGFFYVSH